MSAFHTRGSIPLSPEIIKYNNILLIYNTFYYKELLIIYNKKVLIINNCYKFKDNLSLKKRKSIS